MPTAAEKVITPPTRREERIAPPGSGKARQADENLLLGTIISSRLACIRRKGIFIEALGIKDEEELIPIVRSDLWIAEIPILHAYVAQIQSVVNRLIGQLLSSRSLRAEDQGSAGIV